MDENYEGYMEADLSDFIDEWVAIVDGKVVAHNKDPKKAYKDAIKSKRGKIPLLAKVPAEEILVI
ncbi:MAG: DUF5678 domain-containing protein [Candidatus Aenigmarchaeota archaeon]|nr:DUF5678 domain-containing protein [Candidatus Aenigmarchaeota archaeon]